MTHMLGSCQDLTLCYSGICLKGLEKTKKNFSQNILFLEHDLKL